MPAITPQTSMPIPASDFQERYRGALLGLAIGDALGTTLEFCTRDQQPLHTEMLGGGAFGVAPGEWTDDTAMALCLAESLIACQGFDPHDQMKRYVRWWQQGEMSCQGRCIDIGNATLASLMRYQTRPETPYAGSEHASHSGNGGIMRLAPAVMVAGSLEQAVSLAVHSSRTTHASPDCLDAAALMGSLLWRLLQGERLHDVLAEPLRQNYQGAAIHRIVEGCFKEMPRLAVSSSGYVINTLEAAFWCCWQAGSLEEALILAANLGDDADTVAAVTGQLAGAAFGASGIPDRWLERLAWHADIQTKADQLLELSGCVEVTLTL
jgi:ADP-ribosyl-[dinitrogen reductase] hydrolase